MFVFYNFIKQIDSILLWVCTEIDCRRGQNMGRTSMTHWAVLLLPLCGSCHIFMSSVIYYWTDAGVHEISWLNTPFSSIIIIFLIYFITKEKTKQNKKRHQF